MKTQSSLRLFLLICFLTATIVATQLQVWAFSPHRNLHAVFAAAASTTSATTASLQGTWSGTFVSNNANMPPFTITVILGPDSHGRMVGNASVVATCLKTHRLQATVNGANVVLAGSDADGDNVTFKGTLDSTGTLLTMNYILNGSAGHRCETDQGTGTMGKR
jgi:hypothetical protein